MFVIFLFLSKSNVVQDDLCLHGQENERDEQDLSKWEDWGRPHVFWADLEKVMHLII